jgi:hypothetical protein
MNIGPHRIPRDSVTGYRDDARTEELHKLRLALATFALQLDAFEMRTRNAAFRTGMTPGVPVWPPDVGCRLQGKEVIGR